MPGPDVMKAAQAAAVLLQSDRCKRMSYLRLLKLLYIAEREALAETGGRLLGSRVLAMKHGPVLSDVYDLLNRAAPPLAEYLRRDGYQVELVKDPGGKKLSRYEAGKLREVAERYRDQDEWDLVELTHAFPEWQRHNPEGRGVKAVEIPLRDLVEAAARPEDRDWILQDAEAAAALDRALGK
jgi:uncharacterized phage-associated protein